MSGELGGVLQYGNNESVRLSKNMKFSYGDTWDSSTKRYRNSAWDNNGTVRTNLEKFAIGGSNLSVFNAIIGGDGELTESDLISIMNRPQGNIRNVTSSGNGEYDVEYVVNGERGEIISHMRFDFETDEERAAAENASKQSVQQEENKTDKQPETEKLSLLQRIRYWLSESWLAH